MMCSVSAANASQDVERVVGEAGLLGNFVRCADYLLVEALAAHVIATAEGLAAQLAAPRLDPSLKAGLPPAILRQAPDPTCKGLAWLQPLPVSHMKVSLMGREVYQQ